MPAALLTCVPVLVILYSFLRSTSIHSLTPGPIGLLGHQAPPKLSWRTLDRGKENKLGGILLTDVVF